MSAGGAGLPPALDDGEAAVWVLKVEEGHDEPAKGVGDALGAQVPPGDAVCVAKR